MEASAAAPTPAPDPAVAPIAMPEPPKDGAPSVSGPGTGAMPTVVLASGIASLLTCSCFLVFSAVAIVTGHLTMMKLGENGDPGAKKKVLIGTVLGYVSVVGFLATAILYKLFLPQIEGMLEQPPA
ncbi:MAG: hypothetical protein AAF191_12165 [Verrucomicrobiota bacterium]